MCVFFVWPAGQSLLSPDFMAPLNALQSLVHYKSLARLAVSMAAWLPAPPPGSRALGGGALEQESFMGAFFGVSAAPSGPSILRPDSSQCSLIVLARARLRSEARSVNESIGGQSNMNDIDSGLSDHCRFDLTDHAWTKSILPKSSMVGRQPR